MAGKKSVVLYKLQFNVFLGKFTSPRSIWNHSTMDWPRNPRIRVHCQHTEHAYFVDITEIHSAASAGSPGSGGGVAGCLPPTTAAQLCLPLPPTECQKFMQNTSDQKTFSFQRKLNFNFTQRISFIKIVFLTLYCRWVDISTRHLRIREAIKKKIYSQNVRTHLSSDY